MFNEIQPSKFDEIHFYNFPFFENTQYNIQIE